MSIHSADDGVLESPSSDNWPAGPKRPRPKQPAPPFVPLLASAASVGFVVLMGIVLPLVCLAIELVDGMSAQMYVDPIPSSLHLLMVAIVPVANLLVLLGAVNGWMRLRPVLGLLNGIAIIAGAFYAIIYLPIAPIAVVAILLIGLGLLPLSPIFGVMAALNCHGWLRDLRHPHQSPNVPGFVLGLFTGVCLLLAAEGSALAIRVGLDWTHSGSTATRQQGIWLMRTFASHEQLLGACYGLPAGVTDQAFQDHRRWNSGDDMVQARRVYYQVTGEVFNHQPVPLRANRRGWFVDDSVGFFFDEAQGGEQVAGKVPGLSLAASRMDGMIESDAAVGYLEWTMVFDNASSMEREARALIQLPRGAVVSRLTLWINDEEHEAAFGGSAKVRAAYQDVVVVQRRDPVLVTHAGPDRVMMQCYPVPVDGRMKIRMGITMPLQLETPAKATFALPGIIDRNFDVDESVSHALWLDGQRVMSATRGGGAGLITGIDGQRHVLRGDVADWRGSSSGLTIATERAADVRIAWTEYVPRRPDDEKAEDVQVESPQPTQAIVQLFEQRSIDPIKRVVIVIDGSASMKPHGRAISQAIDQFPNSSVVIASDEPLWIRRATTIASSAKLVAKFSYVGGRDNLPALEEAWDEASASSDAAILWIHGPQPVVFREMESLRQRLQRTKAGPRIYSLQVAPGANHIVRSLASRDAFQSIAHVSDLTEQLSQLATDWRQTSQRLTPVRSLAPLATAIPEEARAASIHASQHLRRLWAFDEIQRLLKLGDQASREAAVVMGKANHLVTAITGAVVLETQAQYAAHGLKQGSPSGSPSIPEPSTALLFAVAGGLLASRRGRRRE